MLTSADYVPPTFLSLGWKAVRHAERAFLLEPCSGKCVSQVFRPVVRDNVPVEGEVLSEVHCHGGLDSVSLYPTRVVF